VLDYRDPWTQSKFVEYPTKLHQRVEEHLESMVLRAADLVVTTTEAIATSLVRKYPTALGKCITIPNGFDSADFMGLTRSPRPDCFTIAYTGRLYGLRTAEHFLTAVRNLTRVDQDFRSALRIVVAGSKHSLTVKLVEKYGLQGVVDFTGFVSHRESLKIMIDADVLLLIMSQKEVTEDGVGPMVIPGKTFEYLAARRPILALVPKGYVSNLVTGGGAGIVVPPDDAVAIEHALRNLFMKWKAGTLSAASVDISSYERRALTASLAEAIGSLRY
jgi:glycosyltransferase involved in cell wall biosynthesis